MEQVLRQVVSGWDAAVTRLEAAGQPLALLALRALVGWEFWEAGQEKLHGENWFADAMSSFPFPFDLLPADLSWFLATWTELGAAVLIWLGLGTRLAAFALLFLTCVATAAVHWPEGWSSLAELWRGYAITDRGHGNFKLPLILAVMLLPLLFGGAGRFSLDRLLQARAGRLPHPGARPDALAWALPAAALGLPLLMLMPMTGSVLLAAAAALAAVHLLAAR